MLVDIYKSIETICPVCLKNIQGELVAQDALVILKKQCPAHGEFSIPIWNGPPDFTSWFRPKTPYHGGERHKKVFGCPLDCGLCENHNQRTCTALIEITSRCNLNCPICFANSGDNSTDLNLYEIEHMLKAAFTKTGGCNLQISGGEPTVHKDLCEIIKIANDIGFSFIQLNSNGIHLSQDAQLCKTLKQTGLSSVFLQFDGLDDSINRTIRGRNLFSLKCKAIENLSNAGIGIVLVPTIVRHVNDDHLYKIIEFALQHQPHIRGVHFQPMSYFGRFPKDFKPDHITLPEIMSGLEKQSKALLKSEDFTPPGCEHALCSFSAKYLKDTQGTLKRLGGSNCKCTPTVGEEGALKSIDVTARQWSGVNENFLTTDTRKLDDLDRFLHRARTHNFSISGMAFQDAWTMNLERLQGCCIHVVQPNGDFIPFCSFNLTSRDGRSLYRNSASLLTP